MVEAPRRGDSSLYRILGFDRLVDLFESKQLYFSHPSAWEDPCEKLLEHRLSPNIFAQCWCKSGVSDAMWRIYSPNQLGVRIRTNKQKLREQLKASGMDFRLKDVKYKRESELNYEIEAIADELAQSFRLSVAFDSLFMKRLAFKHESEVRVAIYKQGADTNETSLGIRVPIDPFVLIESVLIDPRAPDPYVRAYKHFLKEQLGFPGRVAQSALYAGREPLEVW
ncbi:DUF2971 domain-containing protein [Thiobacillus sedimenti]|uniref:DUF2971 domain-containing protein n=1 Tax=Thiobacillus sedimenti TaxID=3110231 RepID=A0ABZ1CMC7_9PROT|nr:DUF2971 domain-containing protein [Thiobacillus sp. SCUT-2]WRS40509.1 DUF2971 domain-containing protein [Thiobacillus sp. SCUT-2]